MTSRLFNRELSWLEFNNRVLSLADEADIPLLERVKFVAICSNNLDEFFQVRVAALKDQVAAGLRTPSVDGLTPRLQLAAISQFVADMVKRQEGMLSNTLLPELRRNGIDVVDWADLAVADRLELSGEFERRIFPVLTPLAVDPAHPFPYISNLALSLAAMVSDPETGERRFARVKVPTVFPRLMPVGDGSRFVPVEQVITAHMHMLFSGMVVEETATFRVTRNADLTLEEEEADDLLAAVELELRRRRFGRAVRLEVHAGMSVEMVDLLTRELDIEPADVSFHATMLDLTCMFQLASLERADLRACNLRSADLRGARLAGAKLHGADLRQAHLGPLLIGQDRLLPADLTGAGLKGADLSGADLRRAVLVGADLERANFSGAAMRQMDISGAATYATKGLPPPE